MTGFWLWMVLPLAVAWVLTELTTGRAGRGAEAAMSAEDGGVVYRVETASGFTDSFDLRAINVLLRLGLIRHERDGHDLADGHGNGVGPLVRHYCGADQ